MPVQDPQIKAKIPMWKVALNLLYSGLAALKNMGLFQRGSGPSIKP